VTATTLATVAAWSYGFALAGYLGFALLMVLRWRPSVRAAGRPRWAAARAL